MVKDKVLQSQKGEMQRAREMIQNELQGMQDTYENLLNESTEMNSVEVEQMSFMNFELR